jgi:hypothetical protein
VKVQDRGASGRITRGVSNVLRHELEHLTPVGYWNLLKKAIKR